ncbi:unnamed protein product [Calypogeia fissa]
MDKDKRVHVFIKPKQKLTVRNVEGYSTPLRDGPGNSGSCRQNDISFGKGAEARRHLPSDITAMLIAREPFLSAQIQFESRFNAIPTLLAFWPRM